MAEPKKDPQKELEIALSELEERVDRLRGLYEQYFMGFEKIEPGVQRKDVDRRFTILRKTQIRNTAQRYRFNVITQKYSTYAMYWQRVCRQIEEGTFKRHLARAKRRFGDPDAKPEREREPDWSSIDVDLADFADLDMDEVLAEANASAEAHARRPAEAPAFDPSDVLAGGKTDPPSTASEPPTPAQLRAPVHAPMAAATRPGVVLKRPQIRPSEGKLPGAAPAGRSSERVLPVAAPASPAEGSPAPPSERLAAAARSSERLPVAGHSSERLPAAARTSERSPAPAVATHAPDPMAPAPIGARDSERMPAAPGGLVRAARPAPLPAGAKPRVLLRKRGEGETLPPSSRRMEAAPPSGESLPGGPVRPPARSSPELPPGPAAVPPASVIRAAPAPPPSVDRLPLALPTSSPRIATAPNTSAPPEGEPRVSRRAPPPLPSQVKKNS